MQPENPYIIYIYDYVCVCMWTEGQWKPFDIKLKLDAVLD